MVVSKEVQIVYRLFLVSCYLLHVPRLPSQPASTEKDLRGWVIEKNWLELAWQYIAVTRNNLYIIWIALVPSKNVIKICKRSDNLHYLKVNKHLGCKKNYYVDQFKCDFRKYLIPLCFFLKVMPLPHIVPRRGWKSCNALANHSNGVGVHSKKHILLPRGSIPCNNGSNNLTPSQFKPKFKISGSINHHTIKDSTMWKKIQKVKWNRIKVYVVQF